MIKHGKEAGHVSKVREKNAVGWGDWDAAEGWGPGAQNWGEQKDADDLARWMPSEEQLKREESERELRERILRWRENVEAAILVATRPI